MRWTTARGAELQGRGLHTGAAVRLALLPGSSGAGIVFRRSDLGPEATIPARLGLVTAADRRTALEHEGIRVETVEHLLAAVAAAGLDDLCIELDAPELPIGDGSFEPFVGLLEAAGRVGAAGCRTVLVVDEPFALRDGDSEYHVTPAAALQLEVGLEYAEPVIGVQRARLGPGTDRFRDEIAGARTFGFVAELAALRARGLIAGADGSVAVVLDRERPVNTSFRWPDECARHKLGDLLGDLALLGAPLRAAIRAERPSHRGNHACARAIGARARRLEEG